MECRKPQKRKNLRLLILTANLSKPGHDVAGLFFCPAAIQLYTSVYSGFYTVHASYTTYATKRRTGLYRRFSCGLSHLTAHNTRPAQAAIMPPAPRRTLYRSTQPPYYNKVYKGATVCPCYRSMPDSAAHRRPCKPGGVGSCRVWIAGKCCTC